MVSKFRSISVRLHEERDADILNFIDSQVRDKRLSKVDVVRQALLFQMKDNGKKDTGSQRQFDNTHRSSKKNSVSTSSQEDQMQHAKELLLNGFTGI